MQVTTLKNEDLDFHVKVIIPSTIITSAIQKEFITLSKKVKLHGFRSGKVPMSIIRQKYKQSVRHDVIQHQIKYNIQHIIKDNMLNIISDPELQDLQDEEGKDLEFVLKFALLPKILIPDFKKILINRPKIIIQDNEINEHINKLAGLSKTYTIESKASIKKGVQVTFDAIGYIDDQPFEGGAVTDYILLIGSNAFIHDFDNQLIGSKTGDIVKVNVTLPENYHIQHVANKSVRFIVTIKALHLAEDPVIDDEFAKKFHCETLEELRQNIAKQLTSKLEVSIYTLMKMSLFNQLENILTFNAPQSLLIQEESELKSKTKQNSDVDSLFNDKSEQEINEYYSKLALRRVKIGLALAEYMKIKELHVTQSDLRQAIIAQTKNFPGQEMELVKFYQNNPKALEHLKGPLLEEKAVQHIFDHEVTMIEKNYTKQEFEQILAKEEEHLTI